MPNLNLVILAGHLIRDPELRYVGNGHALVQFGVATNKEFEKNGEKKKVATFVDCKAWGSEAEAIAESFKKGDGITITGELTTESWEDKQTGAKRHKTLVLVNSAAMYHKRSDGAATPRPAPAAAPTGDVSAPPPEGDVPF